MKLLALIISVLTMSLAQADQYSDYTKTLAMKYVEIAILSAEARVQKDLVCIDGTYSSEITTNAVKALDLVRYEEGTTFADLIKKLESNSSFKSVVAESYSYKAATVPYSQQEQDEVAVVRKNLLGSKFYGPARGVYGNESYVVFKADGVATIGTLEVSNAPGPDGSSTTKWLTTDVPVDITTHDGILRITFAGKTYNLMRTYQWTTQYILVPEGSENPEEDAYINGFVEFASECEA